MDGSRSGKRPGSMALGVGLILILALSGCKPAEPLRVGFVGGISGRGADSGISARDAAQYAVEECNRTGGIAGRKVLLVVKDDEQQPEVAKRVVRGLVSEGVSAIVGPMTSDMAMAIVPLVNEARILMVAPAVTTEALTGIDDYFFRVVSTTRTFASRNAAYQLKTNRMRRVAAVYDGGNKSFTENWLANFRAAFAQGGGEIVATVVFESGKNTTFLPIAQDLLNAGPDGILIVANSMDSALLCLQIRRMNDSIPVTLSDWGATERLIELGGKAVEGVTVVQTFDRDSPAPRYVEFRKAYLERFHREPGFPGVYTFDCMTLVLEALTKQKPGESLKETVLRIRTFEGLQSSYSLDDYGDVKRPHGSISVVRDGKFAVLE